MSLPKDCLSENGERASVEVLNSKGERTATYMTFFSLGAEGGENQRCKDLLE